MAALNSRRPGPFLTYLTIFKSRLGVANIVLELTDFAFQPQEQLSRRLKALLTKSVSVDVSTAEGQLLLNYLADKKLVGAKVRQGGRSTRTDSR